MGEGTPTQTRGEQSTSGEDLWVTPPSPPRGEVSSVPPPYGMLRGSSSQRGSVSSSYCASPRRRSSFRTGLRGEDVGIDLRQVELRKTGSQTNFNQAILGTPVESNTHLPGEVNSETHSARHPDAPHAAHHHTRRQRVSLPNGGGSHPGKSPMSTARWLHHTSKPLGGAAKGIAAVMPHVEDDEGNTVASPTGRRALYTLRCNPSEQRGGWERYRRARAKSTGEEWWKQWMRLVEGTPAIQAVLHLCDHFSILDSLKLSSTLMAILSAVAFVICILDFTMPDDHIDYALSAVTLIHAALVIKFHHLKFQQELLAKPDYRVWYPTFWVCRPSMQLLIPHLSFILVHCFPYLTRWTGREGRLINIIALFRPVPEILHAIPHYTFITSAGSTLVSGLARQEITPLFVYKLLLFKYPILTITFTALFGFCILSVSVWFAEGLAADDSWSLPRSFWYTFVTYTTVGYGDEVPVSVIGKLVGLMSAVFGITTSAVLVSVVQHKLALSRTQKQMILFLLGVQMSHRLKEESAKVITASMKYWLRLKCTPLPIPKHKSVTAALSCNRDTRQLHKCYRNITDAVLELQELREIGDAFSDISVLDVLHADIGDILAQNTVMQYFMNPADTELSDLIRKTKVARPKARRTASMRRRERERTRPKDVAEAAPSGVARGQTHPLPRSQSIPAVYTDWHRITGVGHAEAVDHETVSRDSDHQSHDSRASAISESTSVGRGTVVSTVAMVNLIRDMVKAPMTGGDLQRLSSASSLTLDRDARAPPELGKLPMPRGRPKASRVASESPRAERPRSDSYQSNASIDQLIREANDKGDGGSCGDAQGAGHAGGDGPDTASSVPPLVTRPPRPGGVTPRTAAERKSAFEQARLSNSGHGHTSGHHGSAGALGSPAQQSPGPPTLDVSENTARSPTIESPYNAGISSPQNGRRLRGRSTASSMLLEERITLGINAQLAEFKQALANVEAEQAKQAERQDAQDRMLTRMLAILEDMDRDRDRESSLNMTRRKTKRKRHDAGAREYDDRLDNDLSMQTSNLTLSPSPGAPPDRRDVLDGGQLTPRSATSHDSRKSAS